MRTKTVTATFIVELEGEIAERSDEECKEFVYDLLSTGGLRDLSWTIEEDDDEPT